MSSIVTAVSQRIHRAQVDRQVHRRIRELARQVAEHSQPQPGVAPLIFFNASTRLTRLSLNAAYSLLTAWGVRLQGVPVVHFVCRSAMTPCVLGTNRDRPTQPPPCRPCIAESRRYYQKADVRWFTETPQPELEAALAGLDLAGLEGFGWHEMPLGQIVLPALRWILRRHHLAENADTLHLYRNYILSAWRIAEQFAAVLDETRPQGVVVFNGQFYPEATARWVARRRGIRVIAHEVALQPYTGYFTEGEATAYPIDIPDSFVLSTEQNARLDGYLEQRFQGNFTMAGIRFWPEMRSLSPEFLEQAARFRQIVPVFTNVIFDTSQGHANVVFAHMFAWLDEVQRIAAAHPDTFFVIRAHPDESRPGKESRESVRDWVQHSQVTELPNVLFVDSSEPFSSYELIQRAKFVMIYNSTIGLEASILGATVLCAGKARFTQLPTVFLPQSQADFRQQAETLLAAEQVRPLPEFQSNARRFLYYQLFRTSLPFDRWLAEDGVWRGFVTLKDFDWQALLPENSLTMQIVLDGLLRQGDFLLPE